MKISETAKVEKAMKGVKIPIIVSHPINVVTPVCARAHTCTSGIRVITNDSLQPYSPINGEVMAADENGQVDLDGAEVASMSVIGDCETCGVTLRASPEVATALDGRKIHCNVCNTLVAVAAQEDDEDTEEATEDSTSEDETEEVEASDDDSDDESEEASEDDDDSEEASDEEVEASEDSDDDDDSEEASDEEDDDEETTASDNDDEDDSEEASDDDDDSEEEVEASADDEDNESEEASDDDDDDAELSADDEDDSEDDDSEDDDSEDDDSEDDDSEDEGDDEGESEDDEGDDESEDDDEGGDETTDEDSDDEGDDDSDDEGDDESDDDSDDSDEEDEETEASADEDDSEEASDEEDEEETEASADDDEAEESVVIRGRDTLNLGDRIMQGLGLKNGPRRRELQRINKEVEQHRKKGTLTKEKHDELKQQFEAIKRSHPDIAKLAEFKEIGSTIKSIDADELPTNEEAALAATQELLGIESTGSNWDELSTLLGGFDAELAEIAEASDDEEVDVDIEEVNADAEDDEIDEEVEASENDDDEIEESADDGDEEVASINTIVGSAYIAARVEFHQKFNRYPDLSSENENLYVALSMATILANKESPLYCEEVASLIEEEADALDVMVLAHTYVGRVNDILEEALQGDVTKYSSSPVHRAVRKIGKGFENFVGEHLELGPVGRKKKLAKTEKKIGRLQSQNFRRQRIDEEKQRIKDTKSAIKGIKARHPDSFSEDERKQHEEKKTKPVAEREELEELRKGKAQRDQEDEERERKDREGYEAWKKHRANPLSFSYAGADTVLARNLLKEVATDFFEKTVELANGGQDNKRVYVMVDAQPVAVLHYDKAKPETAKVWTKISTLETAFMAAAKEHGVESSELALTFGLEPIELAFDIDQEAANFIEEQLDKKLAELKGKQKEFRSALRHGLQISLAAMNKGCMKDLQDHPVKAKLYELLEQNGVKHPAKLIDTAFAEAGEDFIQIAFAKADELAKETADARNVVARTVENASYNFQRDDDGGGEFRDRLATAGKLVTEETNDTKETDTPKPINLAVVRKSIQSRSNRK